MAVTKTAQTLVAAGTTQTAGTGNYTRGRLLLTSAQGGGVLTMKITNGGSTLGAQCEARVLIAHNTSLPAAASAGADWKTVQIYGGGVTANAVSEFSYVVHPGVMCLEVEFNGNTTVNVTVEAFLSEFTTVV
jgi:hypothetical protein